MEEFTEWVRCMAVRAFPCWGRVEVVTCGGVVSQRTRKQEDFLGSFGQSPKLNRKGSRLGEEF